MGDPWDPLLLMKGNLDQEEGRAFRIEELSNGGDEGLLILDPPGPLVTGSPCDLLEGEVLGETGLPPRGAIGLIVEDDVDQILWPEGPDHRHASQVHQDISIPVEDDHLPLGTAEGNPQGDGGGQPHGPDHVEILSPILDGEGFPTDHPVGVNDQLMGEV